MKHKVAGKSLNRNSAHRKALRMNFAVAVIKHERVVTTLAKAKALRPFVEKMITLAKRAPAANSQSPADAAKRLHAIRLAVSYLQDKTVVKKLFDEVGPRFANRAGGYTRVLRLPGYRIGDGSTKAIFELVDNNVLEQKIAASEMAEVEEDSEATAGA